MRKNHTCHGFYAKYQTSPLRRALGGRTGHNMGFYKADEYVRLIEYIKTQQINPFGYISVILRFHKNLKRRKTWIRLYNEENPNKTRHKSRYFYVN